MGSYNCFWNEDEILPVKFVLIVFVAHIVNEFLEDDTFRIKLGLIKVARYSFSEKR